MVDLSGQQTEMVLNEYIPFIKDWCDLKTVPGGGDRCPNWQDPKTAGGDPNLQHAKGVGINRETWSWNAAGAVFAYGYATSVPQHSLFERTFSVVQFQCPSVFFHTHTVKHCERCSN